MSKLQVYPCWTCKKWPQAIPPRCRRGPSARAPREQKEWVNVLTLSLHAQSASHAREFVYTHIRVTLHKQFSGVSKFCISVIKWECQTDLSVSFVTQDKIQWWIIYNSFFTPVLNFNEEPKKEESSGKVVFRFQCKTCQKGYSTDSSTAHNLKLHLKVNLF